MNPFERALAEPGSLAARKALLAHWKAQHDPRAELIEMQLALREHRLRGTQWTNEANALSRSIVVATRDHGRTLAGEVALLVESFAFHRGLVAEVTLPGETFVAVAPTLF